MGPIMSTAQFLQTEPFKVMPGAHITSPDIVLEIETLASCAARCAILGSDCQAFTFQKKDRRCRISASPGSVEKSEETNEEPVFVRGLC